MYITTERVIYGGSGVHVIMKRVIIDLPPTYICWTIILRAYWSKTKVYAEYIIIYRNKSILQNMITR